MSLAIAVEAHGICVAALVAEGTAGRAAEDLAAALADDLAGAADRVPAEAASPDSIEGSGRAERAGRRRFHPLRGLLISRPQPDRQQVVGDQTHPRTGLLRREQRGGRAE